MRRIGIGIVLLIIIVLGISNSVKINKKYPNPEVVQINAGEELEYNDACIRVVNTEVINWLDLKENYPQATQDYIADDESRVIHITLMAKGLKETRVDLTEFAVQNGLTATQLLYSMIVETGGTTRVELSMGETKEVDMYFLFYKEWFYEKDWEKWEDFEFYLEVLYTYPTRYLLELEL